VAARAHIFRKDKALQGKPAVEQSVLHGWRGYVLKAGDIAVGIAPDIGGRIISLRHRGEELLFVQDEHKGEVFDFSSAADIPAEKKRLGFRYWGGDKTWIAPQSSWLDGIPPLELDAGPYECRVDANAVVMTSPVCRETGARITRKVELTEFGEIILDQELTNAGREPLHRGIWNVTQCLRPFDVFVQADAADVRAYPDEGDSTGLKKDIVSDESGWAGIACRRALHFKYGCLTRSGRLLAVRENASEALVFLRTFDSDISAEYAHGSCVEIYNSAHFDYLEIEVHAPYKPLGPGESVSHRQRWTVARVPKAQSPEAYLASLNRMGRERI
jgi:hypothetical protein